MNKIIILAVALLVSQSSLAVLAIGAGGPKTTKKEALRAAEEVEDEKIWAAWAAREPAKAQALGDREAHAQSVGAEKKANLKEAIKYMNLYMELSFAQELHETLVNLKAERAALKAAIRAAKSAQQPAAAPKLFSLSDGAAVQKGPAAQIKLKPYPTTVQFKAPFVATSGARANS